jgi:signal transduction histidine kinase
LTDTVAIDERRTDDSAKSRVTAIHAILDERKVAVLGSLAMSIVHDLRSPLAAIHGGAQMLIGSHLPEREIRRLGRNLFDASVRIQELLQEYVDLCRTTENRPQPCNLRSLVAHAVERVARAAEARSVTVVQEMPANLVVTVESHRVRSVLINLLTNALEAMPGGGSIRISSAVSGDSVVVRIEDTGPGIPPEIRDRLFQPFATARKPDGWGFGLAYARHVVRDHGGEIWLESAPGAGACFAFRLPTVPDPCDLLFRNNRSAAHGLRFASSMPLASSPNEAC